MADIAKLKKKAAEFEQKKQLDKALAEYVKILDEMDSHVDEADVALYNRVGDLMLRQGSVSQAVGYYEKAVDLYTEGGFFNNAIALCNKILRNAPGHSAVHYKLGKISAKKGFINDAKQHFLEYADRMQKEGRLEEAFRALKEFADLCPDQDDIRLMLADQLIRRNRKGEAIEQLQVLYEKFQAEGRSREARATVERMRAIDPEIEPKVSGWTPTPKSGDLVFLDLGDGTSTPTPPRANGMSPVAPPAGFFHGSSVGASGGTTPSSSQPVAGFERTTLSGSNSAEIIARMSGIEPTALTPRTPTPQAFIANAGRFGTRGPAPRIPEGLPLIFPPDEPDLPPPPPPPSPATNGRAAAPEIVELPAPSLPAANGHEPIEPAALTDEPRLPSLDDEILGDAAMLPEPDWDAPGAILRDPSAVAGNAERLADEPTHAPRDSGLNILLEQSAFLTPVANPAIQISHDSHRPSEMTGDIDLDAMPELMDAGEIEETPRTPTGDVEAFARALPDVIERAPEPAALESQSEDPPALLQPRDSIDALYGIEERADERAPFAEEENVSAPASDNGLVFIVDELDQARERVATGGYEAISQPVDDRPLVERLRERVDREPENWSARHELAGALAQAGETGEALHVLMAALAGFERAGAFALARAAARDITELQPDALPHHQKHVEMAVRSSERGALLVAAYAGLADCLLRMKLNEKARAIYSRIADLAPDHERAREMLASLPAPANGSPYVTGVMFAIPAPPKPDPMRPPTPVASPAQKRGSDDRFVNLSDWLRDDESPKSTRMVTGAPDPTAAANSDFADMLSKFKEGVAANVDDTDHESHYDLGVAYKEMGLLDEAIAEFQKALRSTENRVRTYEALGQCFVEKKQFQIARTILSRALDDTSMSDEKLIGVLYLLGEASESLGRRADAATYLSRVVAVDIRFRDASAKLAAAERAIP